MLAVSLFFSFVSCGDDDEKGIHQQVTKTYTYSETLRGLKDLSGEMTMTTLTLSDIIGEHAENFKYAEIHVAGCYMEVSGLRAMETKPVLRDFKLRIGDKSFVSFGNCTASPQYENEFPSDDPQSTPKFTQFIQSILDTVTSKKKEAKLSVYFNPTETFLDSDNVKLTIVIKATYHYEIYP